MKNKTQYSVFENSKFMLKEINKMDKHTIPLMLIYALPAAVAPLTATVLLKMLLNILETGGELNKIFIAVGIFVVLSATANIARDCIQQKLYLKAYLLRYDAMLKILKQSMSIPYESIENREKRKMLEKAQHFVWGGAGFQEAVQDYKKLFYDFIGIFSACAIFWLVDYKISIVLLIVGICTFYIFSNLADNEKEYNDEIIPIDKKAQYFMLNKPTEIKAAKDIRIFNISSWFSPILDILIGDRADIAKHFFKPFAKYRFLEMLLILIREGATMYFLISGVLKNKISVSDFAFYFGILNAFSVWIKGIALDFQDIKKGSLVCNDYRAFLELDTIEKDNKPYVQLDTDKACTIEFKNVFFSYDKKLPIIKNVSFKVNSGEKLAIVGENGAGKTTCMKLLSGLYSPDKGEILINGISTADMPASQYFSLFSAVFQDAFSLPASISENVSLSCDTQEDRVTAALKKAGIYDKICTLENGADTMLDKELNKEGIDLSGGEQQKLFLARALYKDAPIIILDEPTAALDPIAENDLYIKFNDLTKDKTSFYISHRLSSTRFCDRILYFKDGQIAESGTHEELMALRGEYFRMYEMQSYYYREEKAYDF